MKKEFKLILLLLSLVIIIGAAFLLYDRYADSALGDNLAVTESTVSKEENNSNSESDATSEDVPLAPDFTVYDINGNKIKLSDFIGKKVIVNFWASWCGPCKNEMPDFQKAYEKYGNDIVFMMVNMTDGSSETVDSAKSFIEKSGYTFPIYFDKDESALYAYYVYSIPATYFISSDGTLASYARGMINEEALTKGIGLMK
ncbi:MAG: TlpA family protein disulfide reductase [Ruminococcaceae bacterium]|nr:TlpA family protein disulfide reductase [Oscillospiraceae bacterium]